MTEAQAVEAILEAWDTGWTAIHPADITQSTSVPWTTRNEAFLDTQLGALKAWARIAVRHSTREQVTHGQAPVRVFEITGNIFVQLFGPVDNGTALLSSLADDVRSVLEGIRTGALCTYGSSTGELDEDGIWAMSLVTIPFRYTQQR